MSIAIIPLSSVKAVLGITDDASDAALTAALPLVTSWFELYCDRGLALRTIVDEEIFFHDMRRLYLWCFPIVSLTSVDIDDVVYGPESFLVNSKDGYIVWKDREWFPWGRWPERSRLIKVSYVGGYSDILIPNDLATAYADAVGGSAGVSGTGGGSSGGGGAIKSIGLGSGALSVSFDTSSAAQKGGVSGSYSVENVPTEVQNYASILDYYKRHTV